jgi:cytochrome c6
MRRLLRVVPFVASAFVVLGAFASSACSKPVPTTPEQEEADLFHNVCARCHGQDGTGGPPDSLGNPGPRNFTDPVFQKSLTDAQIKNTIMNGKRAMPAFGAVFTPAQVDLLAAHVRRLGPAGSTAPAAPASASSSPPKGSP